ncbi:hypothetical protein CSUI_004363 [Cystoisospora suis]|uniref:Uncharacterized protein n=1 Tax=Cystoisospora suis TaxID=483139 RepID=A0A2C6L1T4_9APIC|nr:hypothetical protein CSUI_004363 [Cystoisospora suis]
MNGRSALPGLPRQRRSGASSSVTRVWLHSPLTLQRALLLPLPPSLTERPSLPLGRGISDLRFRCSRASRRLRLFRLRCCLLV